jgi:hypothetical protein
MSIPNGWAEFNDANAVIRGQMVAATGTFSGEFTADNVDAVQALNVRNGAVSAYYGFGGFGGAKDFSFSIPGQPFAQVADVIIPLSVLSSGAGSYAMVTLYRNGGPVASGQIFLDTVYDRQSYGEGVEEVFIGYLHMLTACRFIDFDVPPSGTITYRIVIQDSDPNDNPDCVVSATCVGTATVGIRKR